MLTAILSLLGLGGIGFGVALVMMPGLRLAVSGIIAAIPPRILLALGAAVLLGGAFWLHQARAAGQIKAARAAGYAAGVAEMKQSFDTLHGAVLTWKQAHQNTAAALSDANRRRFDEDLRANAARADDLRLRGPGRASAADCRPGSRAGLAAAAGGPQPVGGRADGPVAPVPPDEPLALVPWADFVARSEDADADRSEALTWRNWYQEQVKALNAAKRELPKPDLGGESPPG